MPPVEHPSDLLANRPLVSRIESPQDLKEFSPAELELLAEEVRGLIIEVAARNGGHLASPLGAVELAIALHFVFEAPNDRIIWDVGHQAHAHKVLTGRKDLIHTIRRKGGLSGYPKRSESEFDSFGTGHSSTSISAGLGMAVARDMRGDDRKIVAVIGDGAMTGGMAIEALSNAGHLKKDLLVVLNDNEMSISKNVGGLSTYLSRIITGGLYNRAKGDFKSFMENTMGRSLTDYARRFEHGVKDMMMPGGMFEELGFRYIGPVDGNDVPTLVDCFQRLKPMVGPILLHCVTLKGKGYPYAEDDPLKYHGVNPYDITTGKFITAEAKQNLKEAPTFTQAFADALIAAGHEDKRIVGITAGMPTGTGLDKFEEVFPDRFFDVGICEQHAVTFAAGLATEGMKPVAAIYSTFLQRAYDQLIHDVCLQDLPVVFAIDRAGLVGEDSPTQQGVYDLSFLRCIPNLKLMAPRDAVDLELGLQWALQEPGPTCLRFARSKAPTIGAETGRDVTRGEVLREGEDAWFLSVGPVAAACIGAAELLAEEGLSIGVADARFIKPLDEKLLERLSRVPIVTVEENALPGGFGSAVMEHFEAVGRLQDVRILRLGAPDKFLDHATRNEQLVDLGLDAATLAARVREFIGVRQAHVAAK